jgi:hypothetical protein
MSSHDGPIGQEWAEHRVSVVSVLDLITEEFGGDIDSSLRILGALVSRYPADAREIVLLLAHSKGRHAAVGCPESCPEF